MASRGQNRHKGEKTRRISSVHRSDLPDELDLRDEIFQLKRQMLMLKKTNERNVVKVRKYEDEAKKKDKQIEQLLDPVKNGDVRKLLSTKGAALLINLKEQNNTLVQMILDKDVQIRRLMTEIKTAKLYATNRKTDLYRTEIDRLRNLLLKSQNLVKEAQDTPQRRSICVGGTPVLNVSPSSEQSSPRDLEELQFTIRSLETHMKYSNELLAKKNEHIMQLTDQLNTALNANQCSSCRRSYQRPDVIFEQDELFKSTDPAKELEGDDQNEPPTNGEPVRYFDKINRTQDRKSNSAPPSSIREAETESVLKEKSHRSCEEIEREECGLAFESSLKEDIWPENGIEVLDEIWEDDQSEESEKQKSESTCNSYSIREEESEVDIAEFELMEKKVENESPKLPSLTEEAEALPDAGRPDPDASNQSDDEMLLWYAEKKPEVNSFCPVTDQPLETNLSPKIELLENRVTPTVDVPEEKRERLVSLRNVYRQSMDSSFDSEISTFEPEVKVVHAEINTDLVRVHENGGTSFEEVKEEQDDEKDDDDDVVTG